MRPNPRPETLLGAAITAACVTMFAQALLGADGGRRYEDGATLIARAIDPEMAMPHTGRAFVSSPSYDDVARRAQPVEYVPDDAMMGED